MITRRKFLGMAGLGAGLLLSGKGGVLLPATRAWAAVTPDLEIGLRAVQDRSRILPGQPTDVWRFRAEVRSGDQSALIAQQDSYLGPTIRIRKGQRVRVHLRNEIPQETIVHWHGLHVPDAMDGHPRFAIPQGGTYTYDFPVINRAGTYWYHPHPHGLTGPQVYGGMAGMLLVTDDEEDKLGLPSGPYDVPVVIQDRTFDAANQLVYVQSPMEALDGFLGERILINGKPDRQMSLATRNYRFRILNASNSRMYRLAWEDGSPLTIIGTDGGLLETPRRMPAVMLGPGERLDLWTDLSQMQPGQRKALVSLPFPAGGMGRRGRGRGMMGRGRRGGRSGRVPANGAPLHLLTLSVDRRERETGSLPDRLSTIHWNDPAQAVNRDFPKQFVFAVRHMAVTINGRVFQMLSYAPEEEVRHDTLEIWDIVNQGMGMMQMPHPVHLHNVQFQVIGRWSGPNLEYMDHGWKDTVLVMPGQRVRILIGFPHYKGLYLYHCHNLEHEDLGMMRNYVIR